MPSTSNAPSMRVCAMDIGTNSTRYMIADLDAQSNRITVLFQGGKITRLGAGITLGKLSPQHVVATLEAIAQFYAHALSLAVSDYKIFGTAALREASNTRAFCEEIRALTGIEPEILSGDEEAALTELAILHSLRLDGEPFIGFDIGGGSAQIIAHTPQSPPLYRSLPLGAVRLTRQFLADDPPTQKQFQDLQNHARHLLQSAGAQIGHKSETPASLIGVGGTVTTVAAMLQNMRVYNHGKIHGSVIEQRGWQKLLHSLSAIPASERLSSPGLQRGREDIIVAGIAVLDLLAETFGAKKITVSDRSVLYGRLVEYLRAMK